jgi:ketosteroid isomerase-like protein
MASGMGHAPDPVACWRSRREIAMAMPRSLLLLPLLCAAHVAGAVEPPSQTGTDDARCAVWARETSFAQAVADHDAAAFAEHLHPDAVFIGGDGTPTHGATAIASDWAGIIEGKGLVLHWYPDAVDVAAGGKLALSRGPYWMEIPAAADKPGSATRYRVGRFVSTWQRGDDGQWQVVFDGGGGNVPVAASEAEIAALAAASKSCPPS